MFREIFHNIGNSLTRSRRDKFGEKNIGDKSNEEKAWKSCQKNKKDDQKAYK